MADISKSGTTIRIGNSQGYLTLYVEAAKAVQRIALFIIVVAAIASIAKALR